MSAIFRGFTHFPDVLGCDVIVTTGGTGLTQGCYTEATEDVIEKLPPDW